MRLYSLMICSLFPYLSVITCLYSVLSYFLLSNMLLCVFCIFSYLALYLHLFVITCLAVQASSLLTTHRTTSGNTATAEGGKEEEREKVVSNLTLLWPLDKAKHFERGRGGKLDISKDTLLARTYLLSGWI